MNRSSRIFHYIIITIVLLSTLLFASHSSAQVSIPFGQTIQSSISSIGEIDIYSFNAIQGDVIHVHMTSTNMSSVVSLYGPDGTLLKTAAVTNGLSGTAAFNSGPLPSTGTYILLANENGYDAVGKTYTIFIALIGGIPGSLSVTPTEGLNATGYNGGPFNPSEIIYTLENSSSVPIEWSLTKTQGWIDISKEGGVIDAGGSGTITISINSSANALSIGAYSDTLTITNITESNRQVQRIVNLLIKPHNGILEVTPSDSFTASGPPGGPFDPPSKIYTLENVGEKSITWGASAAEYWLSLSGNHGALAPGETTEVSIFINENANDLAIGGYTDTVSFTNLINHEGDTTRDVNLLIGVSASAISCNISKSAIILGDSLHVSGQITPSPEGAIVDIVITPPEGEAVYISVLANSLGQFSYDLGCEDIYQSGDWTIYAAWPGDDALTGDESETQTLNVTPAGSRVTLNLTSQSIKLGDLISLSGKFTPQPDCGRDLSGISLNLIISGPYGATAEVIQTNDQWGHFALQDYDGFNCLGEWTVQAVFPGDDAYASSSSSLITLKVVETAGYAIIIEGKHSTLEGIDSHNKTANFVYNTLKDRGLLDDDIKYFNYDTNQTGVDATPTKSAIEDAITIWARDMMDPAYDNPYTASEDEVTGKPANLYIIMIDHGLADVFYIYPDTISSLELGEWIDTLQDSLTGQAADQEIIAILGFCRSGSFIDDISGYNRVIISIAAPEESSYKGPLDQDNIREGEYFVSEFFKGVTFGRTIKSCFQDAVNRTEVFTSSGFWKNSNSVFFDNSRQHPLLDDNGDGIGSNILAALGPDGLLSEDLIIGVSSITDNDPGDVSITDVASDIFLAQAETSTSGLWARVDNNSRLMTLWVEVKPITILLTQVAQNSQ
jgi:hypothetical protein